MPVICETKNGVGLVTVAGSFSGAFTDSFRNQFGAWFEGQPALKDVVVDLGGVGFLDSAGLGALIASFKRVAERGGGMRLARPQPNVKMVLEITCTNRILPIFAGVEEALRDAGS